ncbi:unnamed protein product [Rotaria socialis]|uniref:Uncharacterized protein n=1 Tax=Rotaria socialis TaxID=392032 RepID=A0A818VYZ9_9BILA|nr:unnamed protein product [Rotaria socialis]
MWMLHCELNESKPFHKLDDEIQTFIRQRRPKLQTDTRMSILSQGEEDNRRAALRSNRNVRMSIDHGAQRSKTSIVELSPDQAHTSAEDLSTAREPSRVSLAPLFHGIKKTLLLCQRRLKKKTKLMRKYEITPVRSMADVDAELALLQRRFDSLERIMDDRMKL